MIVLYKMYILVHILNVSWIFNEIEAHTLLTYQGLMPKPSDNLCGTATNIHFEYYVSLYVCHINIQFKSISNASAYNTPIHTYMFNFCYTKQPLVALM